MTNIYLNQKHIRQFLFHRYFQYVLYISCIDICLYESLISDLIVIQPVEDQVGEHILTFFVTNTCGKYDTMILTISIQKLVCIRTETCVLRYQQTSENILKYQCKRTETNA